MSDSITSLYDQLERFSHLQQLHSVLSRDLRASRDKVLKESQSVRKELTFYRWCMRKNLNEQYPFNNSGFSRSMDYDRLVFYRRLISYLHDHPSELGTIIVSLKEIRKKPAEGSLEALYFDNENNLAECVCFDIMSLDTDALVLLLRMILLGSKNFTRLSQQLFQLFIIITCHKPINQIFRPCLDRLNQIRVSLAETTQHMEGPRGEVKESLFLSCMQDVLQSVLEMLRVMPIPLRQVVSVMKHRVQDSPALLLEWLLSTIFSPLLLNPDDWYLVLANPAYEKDVSLNNIQSIVTELLKMVSKFRAQEDMFAAQDEKQNAEPKDPKQVVHILDILLEEHGAELAKLLRSILDESDACIAVSRVILPTSATPDLFTWHKIFLTIDSSAISKELRELALSTKPPNIPNRPWITIALPTFSKNDDITNDGALMNLANEDYTKQPKSKHLKQDVAKPLRMFLLSLTKAQARAIPVTLFTDAQFSPPIELSMQQSILLHEVRGRVFQENARLEQEGQQTLDGVSLNDVINRIVGEYRDEFCSKLENALSTANVLKSLNYLQTKESSLKELKLRAVHAHENLQVRDILTLSKPDINALKGQLQRIANDQIRTMQDPSQGSDWAKDRFVILKTYKWISKSRNALIRFLNDFGIGKVDFKNKYGGSVLNFQDKRVATILVNAIITEIKDIFWKRCPIEDGKFFHQIRLIDSKFSEFNDFYDAFLERNQSPQRPRVSDAAMTLLITEMSKLNGATTVEQVETAIQNCREMLVAAIHGADSATGDDYMPMLCYIITKSQVQHLPSQLQTVKTISQRKVQNKYFIDTCVAMKALRNFANVVFPPHPDTSPTTGSASDTPNSVNAPQPIQGARSAQNSPTRRAQQQQQRQQQQTRQPSQSLSVQAAERGGVMGRIGRAQYKRIQNAAARSRSRSKSPMRGSNNSSGTGSDANQSEASGSGGSVSGSASDAKQASPGGHFFSAMKAKLPTKKALGQMGVQRFKQFSGFRGGASNNTEDNRYDADTPVSQGNPKSPPTQSPPKVPGTQPNAALTEQNGQDAQNAQQGQEEKEAEQGQVSAKRHERVFSDQLELGGDVPPAENEDIMDASGDVEDTGDTGDAGDGDGMDAEYEDDGDEPLITEMP